VRGRVTNATGTVEGLVEGSVWRRPPEVAGSDVC
jgi:hypothetical protein